MDKIYSRKRIKLPKTVTYYSDNGKTKRILKIIIIILVALLTAYSIIQAIAPVFEELATQKARAIATESNTVELPFPSAFVKSWDALKKHAAEMLIYANPVKYDYAVRRIRVSNRSKEARAYLKNMYRYDGQYRYACQMCHDACSDIEAVEMFNNPETELDPINICLCPNCAMLYRQSRNNKDAMDSLKERIIALKEYEINGSDHVTLDVEGQ